MSAVESGEIWNEQAWRTVRPGLLRFLTRRTGSPAAAEDLAQELWLKLARRTGDAPRDPTAYLFHAAGNLARDHLKLEKRRATLAAEAHALLWGDIADEAPPEQALDTAAAFARVNAAIDRLPARTREVFSLNRFDGVPYRDIAKRLCISTTAVENHMRRALSALDAARSSEVSAANDAC